MSNQSSFFINYCVYRNIEKIYYLFLQRIEHKKRKMKNDLTLQIDRIIEVVVAACITTITIHGDDLVTREEILSKSKKQNAVKARHILAFALHRYGYTNTTICGVLGCTKSAVSKMISQHEEYKRNNRPYFLACKSIKFYIENDTNV